VSARHQVKRLDRISEEFAPSSRSSRRNKLSSFGVDVPWEIRNFTGPRSGAKSGPDVFADALVPGMPIGSRAAHWMPGRSPNSSFPDHRELLQRRSLSPDRAAARQVA
jgi:hypothetical protein